MNFLKNRYPFKLLTDLFRIPFRNCESLQGPTDLKRNKSDSSVPAKKASEEGLKLKKNASASFSKTSSEHSLHEELDGQGNSFLDDSARRKQQRKLNRQLKLKLEKLQASLSSPKNAPAEENRLRLKRAYPWQNFNLNSAPLDFPKRQARTCNNFVKVSSSDQSMSSLHSNHSHTSLNSLSSTSKDSLEDVKTQMPLFRSILKKSASKQGPVKEVTFNNISTIYSQKAAAKPKKQAELEAPNCLGRFQPLKEEHSFLYLYTGKKQKTG